MVPGVDSLAPTKRLKLQVDTSLVPCWQNCTTFWIGHTFKATFYLKIIQLRHYMKETKLIPLNMSRYLVEILWYHTRCISIFIYCHLDPLVSIPIFPHPTDLSVLLGRLTMNIPKTFISNMFDSSIQNT